MAQLKTRAGQTAGGGMRSDSKQPNQKPVWDDPRQVIPLYQDMAREGVKSMGESMAFDFRRELGSYLGGLNSTGALRSGAVESGANDIMRTYGDRVGAAASQATLGAMGMGQERVAQQLDAERAAADRKQANKSSIWGGVGSLLGAGVGLLGGKGK